MIAPEIYRQRFLIEGYYDLQVDEKVIEDFFSKITKDLDVRPYGEPIIFSPKGTGKEENAGYDAFIPLIDSGISLYIWSAAKFLSCVIFTCKGFDEKKALESTKTFFNLGEFVHKSF